jgi:hypothetical protein
LSTKEFVDNHTCPFERVIQEKDDIVTIGTLERQVIQGYLEQQHWSRQYGTGIEFIQPHSRHYKTQYIETHQSKKPHHEREIYL